VYTVAVTTELIAQHFLVGGDWGAENERHSHRYLLELQLEGASLDQHGYLVDIVEVEAQLERIRTSYSDKLLNDLPEFAGLNPSIEHFSRIVCQAISDRLSAPNLTAVTVKLWESSTAWAEYRQQRDRGSR
jgi:6-pyruvoyltetrahydropterin/6-carboxytetrahydropterin synthase